MTTSDQQLYAAPIPKAVADWASKNPGPAADRVLAMAKRPVALWIGDWTKDPEDYVRRAFAAGSGVRVLVVYNIPKRDGGSHSSSPDVPADAAAYERWVSKVAAGIRGRAVSGPQPIVLLEPDATAFNHYLSKTELRERDRALSAAVHQLSSAGGEVYVDAGRSDWTPADKMAERLRASGVIAAAGFCLNVSHYGWENDQMDYAQELRDQSRLGPQSRWVCDTSRSGAGPSPFPDGDERSWGNWLGARVGRPPDLVRRREGLRGCVWAKPPWESDGGFAGAPSAGRFWAEAAVALSR